MLSDFVNQFWDQTVGGLVVGSIYALVALGYTMVYGVLRLINFAHSEIFMIGTFATLGALNVLGVTGPATGFALVGLLLLLLVVAMAFSGGAAMLLERVAYRPLRRRGASRLAALISAIGASVFLQELFALIVIPDVFHKPGRIQVAVPRIVERTTVFTIGDYHVLLDQVIVIVAAVIMMVALDQLVNRTRFGRSIRATAQDPETAVLMGVNIDRVVMLDVPARWRDGRRRRRALRHPVRDTQFNVGFVLGIKAFTAAVLGGIGNLRGALLGGLVLGLVENYGAAFFGVAVEGRHRLLVLVLVLMFRPTGILGESLQRARA